MSLSIKVITFPCFSANCYLVTDSQTGESLLIDPGSYGERQREYIKAQGVEQLRYILLTHGHDDHMLGTEKFRDAFGGEVAVHSADEEKLSSEMKSLFSFGGDGRAFASAKADIILSDGNR
ncbi:MAG: MBL fold metallo-hydrolase, partial [Clostridia bacterium]|nr:MBL fold metallo-hydrolase [Clostridia bacterium]